jgi:hypothetical protein
MPYDAQLLAAVLMPSVVVEGGMAGHADQPFALSSAPREPAFTAPRSRRADVRYAPFCPCIRKPNSAYWSG